MLTGRQQQEFGDQNALPVTGFDLPWAVLPGQLVDRHRLAAHPAGCIDNALHPVDFALGGRNQKSSVDRLRNVKQLMRHNLGGIANPGSRRDCHLELLWWARTKARFLRPKHGAGHRNANRLAGQVDDHRQRLALARCKQPRRHVSGHQPYNFGLSGAGVYGGNVNHHQPVSFRRQHRHCN